MHLSAQSMEQVGRSGHVDDLHVAVLVLTVKLLTVREDSRILVAQLEVALQTAGRVLRALTIITVGQGHDEASSLHPLGLARGDELINDALGVVGKVTELGLPHDEGVGGGQRVTILETESTKLAQGRVGDDELALVLAKVLEGSVSLLSLLVVEDSVTLGECSTLNILTGHTDVVALGDERAKGQSLGGREVNVLAFSDGLASVGENTLQVAVDMETFGVAANCLSNVLQGSLVDVGGILRENLGGQLLGGLEAVPGRSRPLLRGGDVVLGLVEALLEHTPDPLLVLVNVLLGEGTLLDQLVDVDVDLGLLGLDALVHERLGEGRLVGLVVTVLSVTVEIDNDIVLELGAPISSELADKVDSLHIIGVDVEDGGIDGLGDIGTVGGRAGETGVGGETNLVVDDEVDGTAGREGRERVESETLVDDTLGSEGGVTVEQNAHGSAVRLLVVVVVLDGTGLAEDNRVLSLKMRRVGDQGELNTLARGGRTLEVHAEMVLDVTRTLILSTGGAGKLTEDGLVGLSHDVAENVETATMGHTDDDVLDTVIDTAVDQRLHTRDEGLTTLKTESLVVGVFGGQERLEAGTPDETVENTALLINGVLEGGRDLKTLTEPIALVTVRDVDELNTERAAVDLFASSDDLTQGHLLTTITLESRQDTGTKGVLGVEVLLGELVVLKGQLLGLGVGTLVSNVEGVNVGSVVTTRLVSADKKLDLEMVRDIRTILHGQTTSQARDTAGHVGDQVRRRLESLGDGHLAALHVLEVDLPRDVDALGVMSPLHVHLINVASSASGEEAIIGIGSGRGGAGRVAATGSSNGQRTTRSSELP